MNVYDLGSHLQLADPETSLDKVLGEKLFGFPVRSCVPVRPGRFDAVVNEVNFESR